MKAYCLLVILSLMVIAAGSVSVSQAVLGAAIPTEGGAWPNPAITILIIPQTGQSWFRSSYTFDVNHAITRWSESIIAYTDAYGSSYLRKLTFTICVSGLNQSQCGTPDIQIQFTESFGAQSTGLGVTSFQIPRSGIFQPTTTTTLAAYDPTGTIQLSDTDMVNIASHEFGHALGLGHANVSRTDSGSFELMFLGYEQIVGSTSNSLEAPSSLDLYALAHVYDWLETMSMLAGSGNPAIMLSLPPSFSYTSVFPYPEQVQMLQDSINQLRLQTLVLAAVVAILLALVLTLAILSSRKKATPTQNVSWGTGGPATR